MPTATRPMAVVMIDPERETLTRGCAAPSPTGTPTDRLDPAPAATLEEALAVGRFPGGPMATRPKLSVVIPAFNESARILPTISSIVAYMDERGEPWELLLVDDGSTDSTVADVRDLGLENLRILEGETNRGKGHAVRRGMLSARGEAVLFTDADQSTPIRFLEDLVAEIAAGADVAVGSRAADGSLERAKPLSRRILSTGLRLLVRSVFRLGIRDTQCGFKLFTAAAADDLFQRQRIDGFSFDLEVLYLAEQRGYSVVEVPVDWHDAPGSTVDAGRVAVRFLRDLVEIRTADLRGRYRE